MTMTTTVVVIITTTSQRDDGNTVFPRPSSNHRELDVACARCFFLFIAMIRNDIG